VLEVVMVYGGVRLESCGRGAESLRRLGRGVVATRSFEGRHAGLDWHCAYHRLRLMVSALPFTRKRFFSQSLGRLRLPLDQLLGHQLLYRDLAPPDHELLVRPPRHACALLRVEAPLGEELDARDLRGGSAPEIIAAGYPLMVVRSPLQYFRGGFRLGLLRGDDVFQVAVGKLEGLAVLVQGRKGGRHSLIPCRPRGLDGQ